LNGACGILVNVTAGPNLTMREFDEIGRIIHDFASEDATVVIGTSLDPAMKDDVRVTVVATGLNRAAASRQQPPIRMVDTQQMQMRPRPVVLRTGTGNEVVDYAQPEFHARAEPAVSVKQGDAGLDYLDIPAFLRRQAD
ncbi:MAG: cell division protein FtsZ, partial [Rhodanobacter sp.]